MNQVCLVGRLVFEPEIRVVPSGKKWISLRLAVSRNDKDKTTDFINCQAWESKAEFIKKYFKKGDPIAVIGRIQTSSYEKQDGTKVNETYILLTDVSFVPQKKTENTNTPEPVQEEGGQLPFEV